MRGHAHASLVMVPDGPSIAVSFLTGPLGKARGLLMRKPDKTTRVFLRCRDIHTIGMRYPIDIAFFDERGEAIEVHRAVGPGRRLRCKKAVFAAERFADDAPWFREGDLIAPVHLPFEPDRGSVLPEQRGSMTSGAPSLSATFACDARFDHGCSGRVHFERGCPGRRVWLFKEG